MRNFVLGFISGLTVLALVLIVYQYYVVELTPENQIPGQVDNSIDDKSDVASSAVKNSVVENPAVKNRIRELQKADNESSKNQPAKKQTGEQPVTATNSGKTETIEKIHSALYGLNQNQLAMIEATLSQINELKPVDAFELESVDDDWAQQKQADLEYFYYESSPLKDIGELESIRCKTTLCNIRVRVPNSADIKPSDYIDWPHLQSINIQTSADGNHERMINIIVFEENK
ncbi:hypothetical protein [Aliikangiella coralliicola]|uniref:Uncharacterized protein n=1 Tax=Aliikangiella coralliicola TaxID=2592383 RepID=A0A545UEM2_9GAMM|nr:hypothetical protein [Aliikangiella coralliicola]TQV87930.1 hypothetical protein FLL46_11165 [Aliikangiella coralliicola]